MKKLRSVLAACLSVALLMTACSRTVPKSGVGTAEQPEGIQEIYTMGSPTLPWGTPPDNWVPVVDDAHPFGTQSAVLSVDNPIFSHEGVSLAVSPIFLKGDTTIQVKPVKLPPPWEGAAMNAYDFSLDTSADEVGLMEIRLPYPAVEGTGEALFGAGYFNESTRMWEPVSFWLDEANRQVVITTDHLSIYSCFGLTGEKTRYAKISEIFAIHALPDDMKDIYGEVVTEAVSNLMQPGQKALELGLNITNDWMGFSGATLTLQGLAYSSDFLSDLSNAFTNVGVALALVQVVAEYSRGDDRAAGGNAIKNATNLLMSKFGASALQVGLVGVFFIDYSLNKFANEALKGRKDIWTKAHALYYKENHQRTANEWYRVMKNLQVGVANLNEFKAAVDAELIRYANLFWQEDDATLAYYQSEAQKSGFTGGGGLNEKLKKEVAEDYRVTLLTGILQLVFQRLSEENRMKQELEYRAALAKVQRQMNQMVRITVTEKIDDGKLPQYAGHYIRFGPLAKDADPKQWTGRINQQGKITASFTVLGHLQAGAPSQLFLYPNIQAMNDNKPSLILDFVVNIPKTEIIIEQIDRQTKLIPVRTLGELAAPLHEDEYVSRYHLSAFPFPMEHLLAQEPILIPKNNVINVTRSGGWSATNEGTGKGDIKWKATYEYQVENMALNINLTQNEKHPVIGGDGEVLFLAGTGTYQYQVTVTTTLQSRRENDFMGLEETEVKQMRFTASGELVLKAENTAIDPAKGAVLREGGVENLKTSSIVMNFVNSQSTSNGTRKVHIIRTHKNGEKEEESYSDKLPTNTSFGGDGNAWSNAIWFRYPAE